jgi:hypothetical protein
MVSLVRNLNPLSALLGYLQAWMANNSIQCQFMHRVTKAT